MAAQSANAEKLISAITTDDDAVIVLDTSDISVGLERCSKSLIGRLLADILFSGGTIESALSTIWAPEHKGSYSVSSGYDIAFQLFHPSIEHLPEQCRHKKLWNLLCDLKCPPKVKVFLWKAFHDGLPVRSRLKNRIPSIIDTCPRCGNLGETVSHCLALCPLAADVWNHFDFASITTSASSMDFWRWWIQVMDDLKRYPHCRR